MLGVKPWPRRPGHGLGAAGKAASRRAVTRTGFSMKTLIAAYSGVLRGEQRAHAASSESFNGRSVVSCEGVWEMTCHQRRVYRALWAFFLGL